MCCIHTALNCELWHPLLYIWLPILHFFPPETSESWFSIVHCNALYSHCIELWVVTPTSLSSPYIRLPLLHILRNVTKNLCFSSAVNRKSSVWNRDGKIILMDEFCWKVQVSSRWGKHSFTEIEAANHDQTCSAESCITVSIILIMFSIIIVKISISSIIVIVMVKSASSAPSSWWN